jgi:hypothetical protein
MMCICSINKTNVIRKARKKNYSLFSWRCPAPPRAQSRRRGPFLVLAATIAATTKLDVKLDMARPKVRPDDNAGPGGSMQLDLLVRRARWAAWSCALPLDGVDQQPASRRVGFPPPHLGLTSVLRCWSQMIYPRTCGASTRSLCRRHVTRRHLTVQRAAQKQRVRPRVQRMLPRAYNRARRRGGPQRRGRVACVYRCWQTRFLRLWSLSFLVAPSRTRSEVRGRARAKLGGHGHGVALGAASVAPA